MPNFKDLSSELKSAPTQYDYIRRKYLKKLYSKTNRNIILYYSAWQQKASKIRGYFDGFSINDSDKNGFMTAIHGIDKSKGLDLFLHTPGGSIGSTEAIVTYLRSIFGNNIRAIVPHSAFSAGTMIALSAKEIIMGKHSSIGAIDPQLGGIPAHGIIQEFKRAYNEIRMDKNDPTKIDLAKVQVWQPIIANYSPTLIGTCEQAIEWTNELVKEWLKTGMFENFSDKDERAEKIVDTLGDPEYTKAHERHYDIQGAKELDLNIFDLESDNDLQEKVLSIHHASILTLTDTSCYKLIENQNGVAHIESFDD